MPGTPPPPPVWPDAPLLVPDAWFPPRAFLPEEHPHPRRDPRGTYHGHPEPAPGLPPERWAEDRTYLHAIDLYHRGYPWESHEHFEACFFASGDARHRALLQSLVQLAAASLQLHRGKTSAVRFFATRIETRLLAVIGTPGANTPPARIAGLDPRALLLDCRAAFAPERTGDPAAPRGPLPRLVLSGV